MPLLIALLALVLLIIVHEFGHFIVAKWVGMRVDEFGLGYPPRALTLFTKGGTRYTVNWLPFGGFVKICGEHGPVEHPTHAEAHDHHAFYSRPRWAQALVLVAGIAMNLLFAYILITGALIFGTPRALSPSELPRATHQELAVADLVPASPAAKAGLLPGDSIMNARDSREQVWQAADSASFSAFIAGSRGEPVTLSVKRNDIRETVVVVPTRGLVSTDPTRYALGVEIATVGVVPLPLLEALTEGARLTWGIITLSAEGLLHFFTGLVTFSADLSQVSGPVGITALIGSASMQGPGYLLSIVAVISVSLALINLIPIPALDGGRLLVVLVEWVTRKRLNPKLVNSVNTLAFLLLIPLMIIVSLHDLARIFG